MTLLDQIKEKPDINRFRRIGKLTVWHHVARKVFDEIVVNIGRQAVTSLADIAHYVERDSTYGGGESHKRPSPMTHQPEKTIR